MFNDRQKRFALLIAAGIFSGACVFMLFWFGGVPIFVRGPWAAACYLFSGLGFNAGIGAAIALLGPLRQNVTPAAVTAPAPLAPPPPAGVNLEAFERLVARVDVAEKKLNGVAFLQGMRARRGPVMPLTDAPESPK